tara:strand:- start:19 stop:243 length:225 start_codon:yes stop_codon:yes gene_type:complete
MSNYHVFGMNDGDPPEILKRGVVLRKCSEELIELACVLTKQANKSNKDYTKKIKSEYSDVIKQLRRLSEYYEFK